MTPDIPHISRKLLDITVTYNDSIGIEYKKNFLLEFSKWEGFGGHIVEREPINQIADTLKNFEQESTRYLRTLKQRTIKANIRSGITNNLDRREKEHQRNFGKDVHIEQVGRKTTRRSCQRMGKAGKKRNTLVLKASATPETALFNA